MEDQGWSLQAEEYVTRAKERGGSYLYQSGAHTLDGCLGALDALWESVYRGFEFLDQGFHRLCVDLLVGVGQ